MAVASPSCIFCEIARSSTTTTFLHTDDKVLAFQDINPSAFRLTVMVSEQKLFLVENLNISEDLRPAALLVEAQNWVTHFKKIFVVMGVGDVFKARLATYKLEDDAQSWWRTIKHARGDLYVTTLSCDDFKTLFYQQYFPSARRGEYEREHYLVIPVEHIATVKDLQRRPQDYSLVSHMLSVGQTLLSRDAPDSIHYRFGFHQPPFNSVNHLHLHCLALPFVPRWKRVKYSSLGPLGGFIEAHKLLDRLKP